VPTRPEWVVLDIGCGTGATRAEYEAVGCRGIGADPSPAMLGRARDRLGPEADGRVLVVDFGTTRLRFPRGRIGRGVTAVAELAAGPRHAANSLDYLRRGGLPALVSEAGLESWAVRPTAGGAITIEVLTPGGGAPQ
jgi:SAM-dependent methyltransferase